MKCYSNVKYFNPSTGTRTRLCNLAGRAIAYVDANFPCHVTVSVRCIRAINRGDVLCATSSESSLANGTFQNDIQWLHVPIPESEELRGGIAHPPTAEIQGSIVCTLGFRRRAAAIFAFDVSSYHQLLFSIGRLSSSFKRHSTDAVSLCRNVHLPQKGIAEGGGGDESGSPLFSWINTSSVSDP